MGFGTVFATIMFIFIFASVAIFTATFNRAIQETAAEQQTRNQEFLRQNREAMTLESTEYIASATVDWVDSLYEDFQGAQSGTTLASAGTILLTGPIYASGTYTSQAIDSGFSSNYTTISWTSVSPANTDITFQLRTANSLVALAAAPFSGPDGTPSTYYTISGDDVNTTLSPARYSQYIAYLITNDTGQTPQLQEVRLGIMRPTGQVFINVTNSGSENLIANETDIYLAGSRVDRNITARVIVRHEQTEQALWNPGEILEIVAFHTLTGAETLTIANDAARAAGSVNP